MNAVRLVRVFLAMFLHVYSCSPLICLLIGVPPQIVNIRQIQEVFAQFKVAIQ